ncbi:MAG: HDOD domain-containing protein [Methylococcaceae bacterium]|nr:HDOD domain-containing protein [Methylococcaceae bacterium]
MSKTKEVKKNKTLSRMMEKLQDLPILPVVVTRLMALSPNDEDFFEKVLELAYDDPPFSVRLIQFANSASQAPATPITTLPLAVARVGAQQIVGLMFSMAVLRVFVPSTKGQCNLWIHAIQVAITSKAIATLVPSLAIDPEQAYLCGLMHDIGRFVLFDESIEELGRIDETNWTTPEELIDAEVELCGFNHAELGWHACQIWKLPKIIQLCVKQHHNYSMPTSNPKYKKLTNLLHVIQVADFFSILIMLEPEILSIQAKELEQKISECCFPSQWECPPCSAKQLQSMASKIYEESKKISFALGINLDQ